MFPLNPEKNLFAKIQKNTTNKNPQDIKRSRIGHTIAIPEEIHPSGSNKYRSDMPATKQPISQRCSAAKVCSPQYTTVPPSEESPEKITKYKAHPVTSPIQSNLQVQLPPYRLTRESASELKVLVNKLANRVETSKVVLYQDGEEGFGIKGDERELRYSALVNVLEKLQRIPCFKDEKLFSFATALSLGHFKVGRCDDFCHLAKRHWLELPSEFKRPYMKLCTYIYELRINDKSCTEKTDIEAPVCEILYNHFFQLVEISGKTGSNPTTLTNTNHDATYLKSIIPNGQNNQDKPDSVKPVTLKLSNNGIFPLPPGFIGNYLYAPDFSSDEKSISAFYVKKSENEDFHNFVIKVSKKMGHDISPIQLKMATLQLKRVDTIDSTPLSEHDIFNIRRLTEQLVICYLLKDFSQPMECYRTLLDCSRLDLLPPSVHYGSEWDNAWKDVWNIKTLKGLINHQVKNRKEKPSNTNWKVIFENSLKGKHPVYLQKIVGTIFKSEALESRNKKRTQLSRHTFSYPPPINKHRDYIKLSKSQRTTTKNRIQFLKSMEKSALNTLRFPRYISTRQASDRCNIIIKKHEKKEHITKNSQRLSLSTFRRYYIYPNLKLIKRISQPEKEKMENDFCARFGITHNQLKKLHEIKELDLKRIQNGITKSKLLQDNLVKILDLSIRDGLSNKKIKEKLFPDLDLISRYTIMDRINATIGLFRSLKNKKNDSEIKTISEIYGLTREQIFKYAEDYSNRLFKLFPNRTTRQKFVIESALKPDIQSINDLYHKLERTSPRLTPLLISSYLKKLLHRNTVCEIATYFNIDRHTAAQWLDKKDKIWSLLAAAGKTVKKQHPRFTNKLRTFALCHTDALTALNPNSPNEKLRIFFAGDDMKEVARRLAEIRKRAQSWKKTDKDLLIKSGFLKSEIQKLSKKLRSLIPQARREFIDAISLVESGQCQSFDHAVNTVHSQSRNLSKRNLWYQKDHFIQSVNQKTASYLQQYFNVELETAQRWKDTQWDQITYNTKTPKEKNFPGNKRSHTDAQPESSSSIKKHPEPKRLKVSDACSSISDNGDNQYLPSSSQSHGIFKYRFPLSRSELLDSLYGGSTPILNAHERAKLKHNCVSSYDAAKLWVCTFKQEVRQGKEIDNQAEKYKIKKSTIERWRLNLEKESMTSDRDPKLASFILDKLYGEDSKNKKINLSKICELAAKEFPASTRRGRDKVSTDWNKNNAVHERDVDKIASQCNTDITTAHIWLENYYLSGQPFLQRTSFKSPIIAATVFYLFNTLYATTEQPCSIRGICKDYINSNPYSPYIIKVSPWFFINSNKRFENSVKNGESPKAIAEKFYQNPEDVKRWIAVLKKRKQHLD